MFQSKNSVQTKPYQGGSSNRCSMTSMNKLKVVQSLYFLESREGEMDTTTYQTSWQNKQRAMPQNRGRKRRECPKTSETLPSRTSSLNFTQTSKFLDKKEQEKHLTSLCRFSKLSHANGTCSTGFVRPLNEWVFMLQSLTLPYTYSRDPKGHKLYELAWSPMSSPPTTPEKVVQGSWFLVCTYYIIPEPPGWWATLEKSDYMADAKNELPEKHKLILWGKDRQSPCVRKELYNETCSYSSVGFIERGLWHRAVIAEWWGGRSLNRHTAFK